MTVNDGMEKFRVHVQNWGGRMERGRFISPNFPFSFATLHDLVESTLSQRTGLFTLYLRPRGMFSACHVCVFAVLFSYARSVGAGFGNFLHHGVKTDVFILEIQWLSGSQIWVSSQLPIQMLAIMQSLKRYNIYNDKILFIPCQLDPMQSHIHAALPYLHIALLHPSPPGIIIPS